MMPVAMVGRAAELAELSAAWSTVASGGSSRTAIVTGAAGLGKSLLVANALAAVSPPPRTVLTGRARVHTPAPYDWLAGVLSGRETGELPVPADALAWLAQHPDAPRERFAPGALLRLAVRTVRTLVGAGPAVLVVEDLHALDPASLNLVGELALAELPALLLVTSRPADESVAPELTARTLARLAGTPGAVRQHLDPLDVTQVGQVLAQVYPDRPVPPDVADVVCERTGGNPYWLTELLATGGRLGPERLVEAPLPDHLHTAAAERTAELTAREVEVLTCLAAGMSNKQVARRLDISIRTVGVHVSNLLRKTRSASRTEAALWAIRHRLTGSGT
jgi:DNA-binding CsgD family transcriptional regulator